jgi:hypothetical protein
VGYYYSDPGYATLILHWDGTSWTQLPSPNPGGLSDVLSGVAAISASDAWAVGYYYNGTALRTLILHWDGTSWTQVSSPNTGTDNVLSSVSAASASNAWAVGYYNNGTARQTLTEHWNGSYWKRVASPNPGGTSHDNILNKVASTSATNAWAVGTYNNGTAPQTLTEHWNGSYWKRVASPDPGGTSRDNTLNGVAAIAGGDAWAVGYYYLRHSVQKTLVLQWNGTSWTQLPSPGQFIANQFIGVAAASTSNVWAVGSYFNGTATGVATVTLAVHCC